MNLATYIPVAPLPPFKNEFSDIKISHDVQVPGWAGTRGDMVFNTNPGPDRVFAWVCLGAHKWQTLKSAE